MSTYYKQSIAICNSNPLLGVVGKLLLMERVRTARALVASNLKQLMEGSTTLNTQAKVGKKAGVEQRTVGYLLDPESTDLKSPKLDTVEKVARAFGLEPWVLLVDPGTFGEALHKMLQRPPVASGRLAELGERPPSDQLPAVGGKKKGGGKKRSFA